MNQITARLAVAVTMVLLSPANRGAAARPQPGVDPRLAERINSILADPALAGGIQGIVIRSLKNGSVWYERNPDLYFMPASNQKLLTSAAALSVLGPQFRYRTRLLCEGEPDPADELAGSLYLEGSGDPTLEDEDLEAFVQAVKKSGIRRIRGLIVGDGSRFDSQRYGSGWSWDYLQDYYAAPVSALNLNRNVVTVNVSPAAEPELPAAVAIAPIPYLQVAGQVITGPRSGQTNLEVGRELGVGRITATGVVARDAPESARNGIKVAVLDPAEYTAAVLKDKLTKAGIPVDGEAVSGRIPRGRARELAAHLSPPLADILKLLNKPSDNLIAECLLKTLGAEKGTGGSTAAGRAVAMRWFKEAGIAESGFDMVDGSGLSRQNVVTPRALAKLLLVMHSHPKSRVFLDSLPIAGVDGSLRNRMKGTPAEGNCRAKTGYIGAVGSLSGYVNTRNGEPLLFVMLMNNHRARNAAVTALQNRIVEMLASWPPPE